MVLDPANPFVYESASRLPLEDLLDVYIPDYNYSRFLHSKRNLIILGDRGSGKTSTLLNNSLRAAVMRAKRESKPVDLSILGIYVPGNSVYVAKRDFEMLSEREARIYAEHYLSLLIASQIVASIEGLNEINDDETLRDELAYVMGWKLPDDKPFRKALLLFLNRLSNDAQIQLSQAGFNMPLRPMGFSSMVSVLVRVLRQLPGLEKSHFSLMIDDVHNLNEYHRLIINSWISYRHTEEISIKIAAAKSADIIYITDEGGSILEGHDYTLIDLEKPFQSSDSNFYKLAKDIVEQRIRKTRGDVAAETYFPRSSALTAKLEDCERIVREGFLSERPDATEKQVRDHVYKYARAELFRSRSSKANLPHYSGFDVITHLSTGVVRNLLQPCYWMFEEAISKNRENADFVIDAEIQDQIIKRLSEELWNRLQNEVAFTVPGCTIEQAGKLYNLFNNLAKLFEDRLQNHASEPRAIVFTVSGAKDGLPDELERLFKIAREFQVLYIRRGSAKDDGERETYYVPNRLLWPIRGLDPVGQHSRVSLQASALISAANGNQFPRVFAEAKDEAPSFFEGEI